jgi:CRISPR-associated Csx11 family protein
MSLSIEKIINNRDEILKAEIGTLLFNLGKTHIGFWKGENPENYFSSHFGIENVEEFDQKFQLEFGYNHFSKYKNYYENENSPFEKDIRHCSEDLYNFFILKHQVNIPDIDKPVALIEFIKGDISDKDVVKQIFFRGCENINSGIDKGSPTIQLPHKLWLSNAFGTIKKEIDIDDFDKSRICFFQQLDRFLKDKDFYQNPDWIEIRKWISEHIRLWYSRLLSDSRYPANDVSLWEQAYMSSSMFKAVCSSFWMEDENYYDEYIRNPNKIKWQILGVQYDKLRLAEKALKVSQISWYRKACQKTDDDIKKILEEEVPLGNEIYRDETGIYFIVSEKADKYFIADETADNNLPEHLRLIQEKFEKNFEGEIFPYIEFSEPSRGLMGLGHLIGKAKENFLKSDFRKIEIKHDENYEGKCCVCKERLASKKKDGKLICDFCEKRSLKRIGEWINHQSDETIWIDDLQGKNGKIALITLKFELKDWLNDNFVNTLLVSDNSYEEAYHSIISFLDLFYRRSLTDVFKNIPRLEEEKKELKKSIQPDTPQEKKQDIVTKIKKLDSIRGALEKIKNYVVFLREKGLFDLPFNENIKGEGLDNTLEGWVSIIDEQSQSIKADVFLGEIEKISFFPKNLALDAYIGCKNRGESLNDFIRQIFFSSIAGTNFEKKLKEHSISSKIDWDTQTLKWDSLTEDDIRFLSLLLVQFSLRKNPSPARLKRVWDTTEDFFKEIKSSLSTDEFLGLSKRYIWNNIKIDDGEYADGDTLFWAKDKVVYLITSTESFKDKDTFYLKSIDGQNNQNVIPLKKEDRSEKEFKPFFSILDPTPVSWQFAVSAEKVPILIKAIEKKYYENFKWVYGKLPLHIGVVFQDHKKPLYLGIKALRKIRRDGISRLDLGKEISTNDFKAEQKDAFNHQIPPEETALCEKYYSLFEKNEGQGKYEFYLFPEENRKIQLGTTADADDNDKFFYYPNTFDFEFLDTNARRNEIFYDKGKRFLNIKKNRPYSIKDFNRFEEFRRYFSDEKKSMELQKMARLIYSKLQDWQGENRSLKKFLESAFINILELKNDEQKNKIAGFLGSSSWNNLFESDDKNIDENLYMFLDMFEFWHTALKEI